MACSLPSFLGYAGFVGIPAISGYAFALLAGFGLDPATAATLFFGIALVNTVRFALSPQTTHWLPKQMAGLSTTSAAAGLRPVIFFELALSAAIFSVFAAAVFVFTQFSDRYDLATLLPFGVIVFSNFMPLYYTLQRQWVSIFIPALFASSYWIGRVGLLSVFVFFGMPGEAFLVAFVFFETVAATTAIALIFAMLKGMQVEPLERPGPTFLLAPTIKNMLGRSLLRGSLREADILCAGLIGSPNMLVEYRIVRTLAFAILRGLGPIVDLAFVGLSKISAQNVERLWRRQKLFAGVSILPISAAVATIIIFGDDTSLGFVKRMLQLDEPGMTTAFLVLSLAALIQVVCIAFYPIAVQFGLYSTLFQSALVGALVYMPLLIVSENIQSITLLALGYLVYVSTILAINFFGVERHVR